MWDLAQQTFSIIPGILARDSKLSLARDNEMLIMAMSVVSDLDHEMLIMAMSVVSDLDHLKSLKF